MANKVSIEVEATDTASPVVERVRRITEQNVGQMQRAGVVLDRYGRAVDTTSRAMESQAGAARNSADQANRVEKEFEKLTSGTEFLGQGINNVRGAITALTWGTVIGAATALIAKMIDLGIQHFNTAERIKKTTEELLKEAGAADRVTEATIRMGNAKIQQAPTLTRGRLQEIDEEINALQKQIKEREAFNKEEGVFFFIIERNNQAIAQKKVRIAELSAEMSRLISLQHQSVDVVDQGLEQEARGRAIQINAVKAYHDRRSAQEALGASILAAALLQARDNAATQQAIGLSLQMAGVLEQQRLAEERLLQAEKFKSTTVVNPFASQEEETRRLIAAYLDLMAATSGLDAQQHLFNMTLGLGLNLIGGTIGGLQSWLIRSQKIGPALKGAAAQAIAAYAAEAAVLSLISLGRAFYLLSNPATAALAPAAFTSAAYYASVATVSGVAARQLANSAGLRSGSGTGSGGSRTATEEAAEPGDVQGRPTIIVQVYALDPAAVNWGVHGPKIAETVGQYLESSGGAAGPVQISYERR